MSFRKLCLLFLMALGLIACRKDELDPAELHNNPFDPGYSGPAIFERDSAWVQRTTVGGLSRLDLFLRVRVRTDLFLRPNTNYNVVYLRSDQGEWASPIFMAGGDRITLPPITGVTNGEEHTWQLHLKNGSVMGAGNPIHVNVR